MNIDGAVFHKKAQKVANFAFLMKFLHRNHPIFVVFFQLHMPSLKLFQGTNQHHFCIVHPKVRLGLINEPIIVDQNIESGFSLVQPSFKALPDVDIISPLQKGGNLATGVFPTE